MRGGHSRDESWRPSHVSGLFTSSAGWFFVRGDGSVCSRCGGVPAGRASVIVRGEARVGRVFRDVAIAGRGGQTFVLCGSAFGGLDNQRSPVFLKKLVTAALSVMLYTSIVRPVSMLT